MTRFVLDSSVLIKWLNQENENYLAQASKIFQDLNSDKIEIFTPEFSILEVANVLIYGKKIDIEKVKIGISDLRKLPINFRRLEDDLVKRALEVSTRNRITVYDAIFVSLAESKNCQLISDDKDHHLKITNGTVLALKDYPL
jgi:predicted nucleic acid-binding protein